MASALHRRVTASRSNGSAKRSRTVVVVGLLAERARADALLRHQPLERASCDPGERGGTRDVAARTTQERAHVEPFEVAGPYVPGFFEREIGGDQRFEARRHVERGPGSAFHATGGPTERDAALDE